MKKAGARQTEKPKGRPLLVDGRKGEPEEASYARFVMGPVLTAAVTVESFSFKLPGVDVQLPDLVNELAAQCKAVHSGDLRQSESMLMAQANSLNAIFNKLAWMAKENLGTNFDVAERLLRLGMKAQTQCRATLETLSTIKNPPVVIARQANVTSGPQQVNNGVAREIETKPNKLLEQSNGKWLDEGAASRASGGDQAMATVGAIDRTEDA